ncbi:uncharacterized protein [Miscanthus floridulus]|uniref:uncharacterized protein n=1 Tax=Miscanthus floridulus TaxID=154761 RepID=UPI003458B15E
MAIPFDQGDHPDRVPQLGHYLLMVNPIDGHPMEQPMPRKVPFYRIIPGKEVVPLGRIWLSVTFGQPNNFHKETLTFELKMFGPKGVITVEGIFEEAYYHEQDYVTQVVVLITPYAPDGPIRDTGRMPVEEATKAVVVLNQSSAGEASKVPGSSDCSVGPSI